MGRMGWMREAGAAGLRSSAMLEKGRVMLRETAYALRRQGTSQRLASASTGVFTPCPAPGRRDMVVTDKWNLKPREGVLQASCTPLAWELLACSPLF